MLEDDEGNKDIKRTLVKMRWEPYLYFKNIDHSAHLIVGANWNVAEINTKKIMMEL